MIRDGEAAGIKADPSHLFKRPLRGTILIDKFDGWSSSTGLIHRQGLEFHHHYSLE